MGNKFCFLHSSEKKLIISPIRLKPNVNHLKKCLDSIISGFELVRKSLSKTPAAISFAFPRPADYPIGIIGDLPSFSAFLSGVALAPRLEHHFNHPVFINEESNLFAFNEALCEFLPELNQSLSMLNSAKQYYDLIGVTLGPDFDLVSNGHLVTGDNSNSGQVWRMRDLLNKKSRVEERFSQKFIKT